MIELLDCAICSHSTETALSFPKLPLTGIYTPKNTRRMLPTYDQALQICQRCGHAQLKNILDPQSLYGEDYTFRTSASVTAQQGASFFSSYVERLFSGRRFQRILEFGCNDSILLNLLKPRGEMLMGLDPVMKGREKELSSDTIRILGERIEDVDVVKVMNGIPDLIVSQHTLEHIVDPKEVLSHLLELSNSQTHFVMEFPCFDLLLEQFRFDQVFHQHLHYYSLHSISKLLEELDAEVIDYTFNPTYWGALLIAFRKKGNGSGMPLSSPFVKPHLEDIQKKFRFFKKQMEMTKEVLSLIPSNRLFGYGAALMLPVLGYHLETDFQSFQAILDDDPLKDGLGYPNLEVRIMNPKDLDLADLSICLTAMDNRRPILAQLKTKKPRQIINPLLLL